MWRSGVLAPHRADCDRVRARVVDRPVLDVDALVTLAQRSRNQSDGLTETHDLEKLCAVVDDRPLDRDIEPARAEPSSG